MEKPNLPKQIDDFWEWFNLNLPLLEAIIQVGGHPKTDDVVREMDQHVLGMGKIKWEIGNPQPNQFSLTLSPNNEHDLLEVTNAVVSEAPQINGWTFFYAAQATGKLQLQVYDHNMDVQSIDAKPWRVVLTDADAGKCELTLEAANIEYLDEDTQMIAADLVLTALLGEEEKINQLAGLELVFELEESDIEYCFPIAELPQNL